MLVDDLAKFTHAVPDRRHGEWHIPCPQCGKESSPKNPHFSFSSKGAYCFVCGYKASLRGLAERLCMGTREYSAPAPRPEPRERPLPAWTRDWSLLDRYENHPRKHELWQSYKPLSPDVIEAARLGVGILPLSKCPHERLIVPVFDCGSLVGLRGRSLGCDCGKWLVAGGTTLEHLPLYNQDALRPGAVVVIVENCVDALMISPYIGVATYSVSYWRDAWTDTLLAAQPEVVIVAYDNDLPGNGGAGRRQEFEREWLRSHPRLPVSAGPRLVNHLLAAGLTARLYNWGRAANKTDVGAIYAV